MPRVIGSIKGGRNRLRRFSIKRDAGLGPWRKDLDCQFRRIGTRTTEKGVDFEFLCLRPLDFSDIEISPGEILRSNLEVEDKSAGP